MYTTTGCARERFRRVFTQNEDMNMVLRLTDPSALDARPGFRPKTAERLGCSAMSDLPVGLHFYWYEPKPGDEHPRYWGQLCGSMHRLAFVREELDAVLELSEINLALEHLAYHMENYLVRIYELRERAAKLVATCGGHQGGIGPLKGRDQRQRAVARLGINQPAKDRYLELLSILDDDIALRNQNTHDTLLSLGYSTGHDIYDPHDALLDVQTGDSSIFETFRQTLRDEIDRTVQRYSENIDKIIDVTRRLLDSLDFARRPSATD